VLWLRGCALGEGALHQGFFEPVIPLPFWSGVGVRVGPRLGGLEPVVMGVAGDGEVAGGA